MCSRMINSDSISEVRNIKKAFSTRKINKYFWLKHVSIMHNSYLLCTVLVILHYCVNDINGFNLENRLPIVKYGDAGTYFGYSVAGHVTGEIEDEKNEKW